MIRHIWFQNRQNQLKKSPPEENETEAQNVIFNWGRLYKKVIKVNYD
jgi:hypothetical protein